MLDKIIHFSIKNKLIIGIFTLCLSLWGIWSLYHLNLDAVPDITNNQVQIITTTPTLAAQETEQLVTFPIEQSIANIPDIEEIRSISRFGLSVVTVVFKEKVDIYFARQLINERLQEAVENIPKGLGTPELAPVSTGLGEVYQYVIHPAKGSEDKYEAMELRSMQDWIVARNLVGLPGVAEINSFGGDLKQYEVALIPEKLKGMNVSIAEVFDALAKNNENTGGAYIEKGSNAYYIRGIGLVKNFKDIEQIVVKKVNDIPLLIRDVATVRLGKAVPYGALTYNGEKEVVGGIVMMLKGANSNEVVAAVKERLAVIQKSLPQDVIIEPFLDRTELVSRTVSTVTQNLIEGALIVIFVLVLFLGNWRAGLIVASAIPLSMLFAIAMMHWLGISANLMSLGAIDFGLIVDGAVIIVEAVMHHLGLRKTSHKLTQKELDEAVYHGASKIRKSASFGEIIILIVYIPILALVGVEGKMFKPMAQTVSFAIIGALVLSLTYIPMMSALFLSKNPPSNKKTFSDKMMEKFQSWYHPVLKNAIRFRKGIIVATVALFIFAIAMFSRMGGEFIPQLQEGDYAFHCILPTGTSLQQSIETSMLASRILKKFPEVKMVIGKTGSAEVPTDPMPPEATDLIVVLKPKKEWKTTKNYNALADSMMNAMAIIPGVFFEKSQPIQMRFNELMTGVRQDVAVKIFGENIDTLKVYAEKAKTIIEKIPGAGAPQLEATLGLPQIVVNYDRAKIANYGLNIQDINKVITTAFAGMSAGAVYENERKYDLTVRLQQENRTSIDDVKNLFVTTPDGIQIPLYQLADIHFQEGPAQIRREDGKRNIVIGFNASGRDVASLVEEVQTKLQENLPLPVGYIYTYGGTFENLQAASQRLAWAVPLALFLIFILLYFTFHSFKDSLLIFSAIPLSAIGGIFALWLRGMPFSISAGIGFIALFGVAVLNGIVLLGTFRQLEQEGLKHTIHRVFVGTSTRLRPVLMTATVASLGFLPMAISTGAGAEVQKPLATVVIGGLISATLLTLIVLPLLYISFNKKISMKPLKHKITTLLLLLFSFGIITQSQAQTQRVSLEALLANSSQNLQFQMLQNQQTKNEWEGKAVQWLPKTGLFVENEDFAPSNRMGEWKVGLSQEIPWPGVWKAQQNYLQQEAQYWKANQELLASELKKDISQQYYELWYLQSQWNLFLVLEKSYQALDEAARLKVRTGDRPGIDSIISNVKWKEISSMKMQTEKEMELAQIKLAQLLNTETLFLPLDIPLEKIPLHINTENENHPALKVQQEKINMAGQQIEIAEQEMLPDFSIRVFSQKYLGIEDPLSGFSLSVNYPLFGRAQFKNKKKALLTSISLEEQQLQFKKQEMNLAQNSALKQIEKSASKLEFYETIGLKQAKDIFDAAMLSYNVGEISLAETNQYLIEAIQIQKDYLNALNEYNQSVLLYQYYQNN